MKVTNGVTHPDIGRIYKCKCGRKILVERLLIGTNHTAATFVCCWDCISEENKKRAMKQYELEEK